MSAEIDFDIDGFEAFKRLEDRIVIGRDQQRYVRHLLSSGDRYYHNVTHPGFMFAMHEQLCAKFGEELNFTPTDHTIFVHSIFFHDAIQIPTFKDNERLSAELWLKFSGNHTEYVRTCVKSQILRTADHFSNHVFYDKTQWFLGLDLLHFAKEPFAVEDDDLHVRSEYIPFCNSDYEVWEKGRKAFLKHVLYQPKIFRHPVLFREFENNARENITRLLTCDYP